MKATTNDIITAWYNLLNGQVGTGVEVYVEDAPENPSLNYVLLRAEGGTSDNTKQYFADNIVVITDIVTTFENNIDRSICETIDNAICQLILPTRQNELTKPSGLQIHNVEREDFGYLYEFDGVKKYYRKVSRWNQYVFQQ